MRDGHKTRGLKTGGVDEIPYCKSRKYATIVCDLNRVHVLWTGRGKGRETIDRFFNNFMSKGQKGQFRRASCDMSQAYIRAIEDHCPNAKLVIDCFHVIKALNEAVDEVRKEQWRALDTKGRKAIKGLRWLLAMYSDNRTKMTKALSKKQPVRSQRSGQLICRARISHHPAECFLCYYPNHEIFRTGRVISATNPVISVPSESAVPAPAGSG